MKKSQKKIRDEVDWQFVDLKKNEQPPPGLYVARYGNQQFPLAINCPGVFERIIKAMTKQGE